MGNRWLFSHFGGSQELAARAEVEAKIDAWWEAFGRQAERIEGLFSRQEEWDLPAWMATHLQAVHPQLMWEYGPALRCDGHRLVITPEAEHHLRPLTRTILERAPRFDGWEFYAHRLPEDAEMARQSVECRTGVDISDFQVRVSRGDCHRVDLSFHSPSVSSDDDRDASHAAFVATESLVGEECLDRWIGVIEARPAARTAKWRSLLGGDKGSPRLIPLERLRETVQSVIGSIRDQLPSQPHSNWVDEVEWTLWKLKPEQAVDYPAQDDLFVGKSPNPALWTAAHRGGVFYSERFSRNEETFCYVKLDGAEGLDEEEFADKSEIEDALDDVLRPSGLGCQIGGGTGLRYSYVDLALSDINRGVEAVRDRLQKGNVPRRSWIQFFDTDLSAEWIGVYDDSPAPPMGATGG